MVTEAGAAVRVITHGLAIVPLPVTVLTPIPALVRAVLRFAAVMFQSFGTVVLESTVRVNVPATAGPIFTL